MDNTASKDTAAEKLHDHDPRSPTEKAAYLKWVQRASYPGIAFGIAELVLAALHWSIVPVGIAVYLTVGSVAFLGGAVASWYWSQKETEAAESSTDLYSGQGDEKFTKSVFIISLLLAGFAISASTQLFMKQRDSADYITAWQNTDQWKDDWEDTPAESVLSFIETAQLWTSAFLVVQFFYFLLTARASFKFLSFGNRAMSYVVFLGNILLLGSALALVWQANSNTDYNDYPHVSKLFPAWNTSGLLWLGVALSVVAFLGFVVDHRNWRIGFFVLSFVLLLSVILLTSFTGFAYRHARHVASYYETNCSDLLTRVHEDELINAGCPAKYLEDEDVKHCSSGWYADRWEGKEVDGKFVPTCLNIKPCCGILSQVYSDDLIQMADFGLWTTLAAALVSMGCYYFWYVSWVDTNRDKGHDFIWLGIMGAITVAFVVVFFVVDGSTVEEKLNADGLHY